MKSKSRQQSKHYSVNALSKLTGRDRHTLDKLLTTVKPSAYESGSPRYSLADVEVALAAKPDKSLREEKLSQEIRKLRIANDKADRVLLPVATFHASLRRCLGPMRAYGEQKICNELPAAIVGLNDVNQGRLIAERFWDDLMKYFRDLEKEWPH